MFRILDENREVLQVKTCFTLSIEDKLYFVREDEQGDMMCQQVRWMPWHGTCLTDDPIDDETLAFISYLVDRFDAAPGRYPMLGEHYIAEEDERGGLHLSKMERHKLFRPMYALLAGGIRFLTLMIAAVLFAIYYIKAGGGIGWATSLLPFADRQTIMTLLGVIQAVGSTVGFCLNPKCDAVGLVLSVMLPLSFVTLLGAMWGNLLFGAAVVLGLAGYLMFYLYPRCQRLKQASVGARKEGRRYARSHVAWALAFCAIVSYFAIPLFSISPRVSIIGDPLPQSADATLAKERFAEITDKLKSDVWDELNLNERIDILRRIGDYECLVTLGCPTVPIGVEYLDETTLGYYSHRIGVLRLNKDWLAKASNSQAIRTLLHEIRHRWQHTLVDFYNDIEGSIDEKWLPLDILALARTFRLNSDVYQDSDGDYDKYDSQPLEADSDEWAQKRFEEFYRHLLEETNEEPD